MRLSLTFWRDFWQNSFPDFVAPKLQILDGSEAQQHLLLYHDSSYKLFLLFEIRLRIYEVILFGVFFRIKALWHAKTHLGLPDGAR